MVEAISSRALRFQADMRLSILTLEYQRALVVSMQEQFAKGVDGENKVRCRQQYVEHTFKAVLSARFKCLSP